jgi:hypothetical protein
MVQHSRSVSANAANAASVDTPFPRGGAVLTALEQRKLHLQAKAYFEREASTTKRSKRKSSFSLAEAGYDDEEVLYSWRFHVTSLSLHQGSFAPGHTTVLRGNQAFYLAFETSYLWVSQRQPKHACGHVSEALCLAAESGSTSS